MFGLLMFVSTLRFFWHGWIDKFFIAPAFHFKYWGFSWVEAWGATGMYLHFALLLLLSVLIAVGLFYRVAAVLFFLAFTYVELIDVSLYLNHYYLVTLLALLLVFVPAHGAYSLDSLRNPRIRTATVPALALYLLRFQVGLVYSCAGLAKLGGDWLIHAQPLNLWFSGLTDLPVVGPWLAEASAAYIASWFGFLFDSTIVVWLSWRRTRAAAFATVVAFHAATGILFPIGMFPLIMVTAATLFFAPDWPRRLIRRLPARQSATVTPSAPQLPLSSRTQAVLASVFLAYATVQVSIPFRYTLYPGNVLWHEQGLRFSWRVLVREKSGMVAFRVRNPQTNKSWVVTASDYLQDYQERDISTQPDMIWQLAQHVAADFERRGYGPVEVRTDAFASLNGRPAAMLIDPGVDLRSVSDGLGAKPWILPAPEGPPPRLATLK